MTGKLCNRRTTTRTVDEPRASDDNDCTVDDKITWKKERIFNGNLHAQRRRNVARDGRRTPHDNNGNYYRTSGSNRLELMCAPRTNNRGAWKMWHSNGLAAGEREKKRRRLLTCICGIHRNVACTRCVPTLTFVMKTSVLFSRLNQSFPRLDAMAGRPPVWRGKTGRSPPPATTVPFTAPAPPAPPVRPPVPWL